MTQQILQWAIPAAIVIALGAAICAGAHSFRAIKYRENFASNGMHAGRRIAGYVALTILALAAAAYCAYGTPSSDRTIDNYSGAAAPEATPMVQQQGDPTADPNDPSNFMDAVHLTGRQKDGFVSRYSLDFITWSLANTVDKTERLKSVRGYAGVKDGFDDAVDHPVEEWFPRVEELRNVSKLSEDEYNELMEAFFEAFEQHAISNIPWGEQFLEGMKEIKYIYRNNAADVDSLWGTVQAMYAGTYSPASEADDNDLNDIPALPAPYIGLDYLVQSKTVGVTSTLVVKEEWARTVAYIGAVYRGYHIIGVQSRTSSMNWHMPDYMADSEVIPVLADYQESREALILGATNKNGQLVSIIGINLTDSRFEVFPISTPSKPTSTPTIPDTPPSITPNTPEEPEPQLPEDPPPTNIPKRVQYELRVHWILGDETNLFPVTKENHYAGDEYKVKVKEDRHYEIRGNNPEIKVIDRVQYVNDVMPDKDHDVYVVYDPYLYIYYIEGPTGNSCSLYGLPDYADVYCYGEHYNVPTPSYLNGWIPDLDRVEGDMPATYKIVYVTFWPPADGLGGKNPADSSNWSDADTPHGGGENDQDPDYWQEGKPPKPDYPEEGGSGGGSSNEPLTPDDDHESSGGGGEDHPIQDGNGGNTDNGDVPPTDPIPPAPPSTGSDLGTGEDGSVGDDPPGDGGWEDGGF